MVYMYLIKYFEYLRYIQCKMEKIWKKRNKQFQAAYLQSFPSSRSEQTLTFKICLKQLSHFSYLYHSYLFVHKIKIDEKYFIIRHSKDVYPRYLYSQGWKSTKNIF